MSASLHQRIADFARRARLDPACDADTLRAALLRIELSALRAQLPVAPKGEPASDAPPSARLNERHAELAGQIFDGLQRLCIERYARNGSRVISDVELAQQLKLESVRIASVAEMHFHGGAT